MSQAIVELCKALAKVIDAHYQTFDPTTSNLMNALADYVLEKGKKR